MVPFPYLISLQPERETGQEFSFPFLQSRRVVGGRLLSQPLIAWLESQQATPGSGQKHVKPWAYLPVKVHTFHQDQIEGAAGPERALPGQGVMETTRIVSDLSFSSWHTQI